MGSPDASDSAPADPIRGALEAVTRGDWTRARAACDTALAEARTPAARGDAQLLRAVARHGVGDHEGSRDDAHDALLSWAQAGSTIAGGHLVALSRALAGAGERRAALRFLAAAVEVIVIADGAAATVAVDLGVIAAGLGEEALARRAWESAARGGMTTAAAVAHLNLARLELDAGRATAALDHAEAALRCGPGPHIEPAVAVALDICAELESAGNVDGVAAVLARVETAAPAGIARTWHPVTAALEYDRGLAALRTDDLDTAAERLATAAAVAVEPALLVGILTSLAGVDLRCGRTVTALARAATAAENAHSDDERLQVAAVLVEIGETASARAEWAQVGDAFSAAAALYSAAGRPELGRAFSAAANAGRVR